MADYEYNVLPSDRWSVLEDYTGIRGHATSMRPESKGQLGEAFALSGIRLQQQLSGEYTDGTV